MDDFKVGGPREPVYDFMRQHGFVMSNWSDKVWTRADGMFANIYGAGSRIRLIKDGADIADDSIRSAMQAMALVKKFKLGVGPTQDGTRWKAWIAYTLPADHEFKNNLNHAICECVAKMQLAKQKQTA